jgi:hypothetical protein
VDVVVSAGNSCFLFARNGRSSSGLKSVGVVKFSGPYQIPRFLPLQHVHRNRSHWVLGGVGFEKNFNKQTLSFCNSCVYG